MSDDSPARHSAGRTDRPTATGVVSEAVARIRRDPALVVPFAVASAVLAGLDWLRLHDPVPTRLVEGLSSGTVSITFHVYPTAARQTALPLAALVDLKLPYLAWAVGLELLAVLAVGVAGWYTLARAANRGLSLGGLGTYLGLVVAVQAAFRVLGSLGDLGPVVGVVLLVVVLSAMVRLFVAPLFVVAGDDLSTASRRSASATTGMGFLVGFLVVLYGFATWALGSVPSVGVLLTGTLVAPVHAVTIVVVSELDG